MADIEIVIKIAEEEYEEIISSEDCGLHELTRAIANGIPLPKGHGRIADMDEAIKCLEDLEGEDAIWAIALIDWACGKRTIIEADNHGK